jgi:hypothetical protein
MPADNGNVPPPPAPPDIWHATKGQAVHYIIRHPWQWVMESIQVEGMTEVTSDAGLPSAKNAPPPGTEAATPSTPSTRRRRQKQTNRPCTLKVEVSDPATGQVEYAVHGASAAFEGLEDKDELVRTIQRCRCEELHLSPPSILINWDVTKEECNNVIGKLLPKTAENTDEEIIAVLKEPMGSQGQGIYFVKSAEDIHKILEVHRKRAEEEPAFLDNLIAQKGRIPSWGK